MAAMYALLAWSGRAVGGFGLVDFVQAALDHFGIGVVPELVPQAHGHAPMRHDAVGIVEGNLRKFFFRLFVPERVKQRHAALEGLLHIRRARDREGDGAQLRGGQIFMVMLGLFIVSNGSAGKTSKKEQRGKDRHKTRFIANPTEMRV